MAKQPIPIGNIRVEDEQLVDFYKMLREHFGKHRSRNPDPDAQGAAAFIEREFTDLELSQMMTAEIRQIWRDRYRDWKRKQTVDPDIDLS